MQTEFPEPPPVIPTAPVEPPAVPAPALSLQVPADYLTPQEIAAALRTDADSVLRWLNIGVTARNEKGERVRVRLKGRKIGGRWKVPAAELEAFIRATSGDTDPTALPIEVPAHETEAARRARVERCLARLADAGMLA